MSRAMEEHVEGCSSCGYLFTREFAATEDHLTSESLLCEEFRQLAPIERTLPEERFIEVNAHRVNCEECGHWYQETIVEKNSSEEVPVADKS